MIIKKFSHLLRSIVEPLIWKLISPNIFQIAEKRANDYKLSKLYLSFKCIGEGAQIPANANVFNPKYISIGKNFSAWYNLRLEAIDSYLGDNFIPQITIGNNVNVGSDCHIGCINHIYIGDSVLVASKVYISDHFHGNITANDLLFVPAERRLYSKGPVYIMDNVWVGEGVCIMPGVTIGKNSIIGANSVVTKSFPENSVIAGNPAKLIKSLIIESL